MPTHGSWYLSSGVSSSGLHAVRLPTELLADLSTPQLDKELGWTLAAFSLESLLRILVAVHNTASLSDGQRGRPSASLES